MNGLRQILLAMAVLLLPLTAYGSVSLTSLKPTEQVSYNVYSSSERLLFMGDISVNGGFTLGQATGYFIAPDKVGMVKFDLGGKYSTLTFVLGPMGTSTHVGSDASVIVVNADGRKLLDEKYVGIDLPRTYTLDVKGVKELKFDVLFGETFFGIGKPTLWRTDEQPVKPNLDAAPATDVLTLVKDLRPYYYDRRIGLISPNEEQKELKINGKTYTSGLSLSMTMQISGGDFGCATFNLKKRYDKLRFVVGPVDNDVNQEAGKGWVTIKTDGRIAYELELGQQDMAQVVELDVAGVDLLSFHSEQTRWNTVAGFADIKAYPKGMVPELSAVNDDLSMPAPDPRLASLPDVCKLMSSIEPYNVLGSLSRDKMLYTGQSDYYTFSMGGIKHSEGMIFTSSANVFHDNVVSSASFDLGNQFDFITFTAGYIGKSINMKNDEIYIYADDSLLFTVPIVATAAPVDYWVRIDRCRKLTFVNKGGGGLSAGACGIADIVLYRGMVVDNDLFVHPKPDCPDEVKLVQFVKPYIHYITTMNDYRDRIFYDGSSQRNYWTLPGGTRVNNGFMLQTNVHFSIEHGVLADDPNAATSAIVASMAVGAPVVVSGAVGGVMFGTSMAGLGGLLLLAAGGEAEEASCAAFNTWGEYNSVTFTVACLTPESANLLEKGEFGSRQQRLLIGADGEVAAELLLHENGGPATFTVPINGCHQLMFWMPCDRGSGKYIVYDAVLSKRHAELQRPDSSVVSHAVVDTFYWKSAEIIAKWERPQSSGSSTIDDYFADVASLYNSVVALIEKYDDEPRYEFHTTYLKSQSGKVCKATQVVNNGGRHAVRNATGVAAALGANFVSYKENVRSVAKEHTYGIEKLQELSDRVVSLRIDQASATLDLISVGFAAVRYGKEITRASKIVDQCAKVVAVYLNNMTANYNQLAWLLNNAIVVDNHKSTDKTIISPLASGEQLPADAQLQLVETFVEDKDY